MPEYPDWIERLADAVTQMVRDDPLAWLRGAQATSPRAVLGETPAWLRDAGRPTGTGGHRATAAEKRAAYARFEAVRAQATRPPVFASMHDPAGPSPLVRRIFGAGQ